MRRGEPVGGWSGEERERHRGEKGRFDMFDHTNHKSNASINLYLMRNNIEQNSLDILPLWLFPCRVPLEFYMRRSNVIELHFQ